MFEIKQLLSLTDVFEDFIALVEDEHLQVVEVHRFVLGEVKDATGRANNDMRGVGSLEKLFLLFKRLTAQDALCLHVRHEF